MSPRKSRNSARTEPRPAAIRLQKLLADAGVASRRTAEEMILDGRVRVNGEVVTRLGSRANPFGDHVTLDGQPVGRPRRAIYHLLHKPRGVVTTTRDPHAKRTVLQLIPGHDRIFPVGRLDAASEGLLLLTNDGELAQVLLHPSFEIVRTYRVRVKGRVQHVTARRLASGIDLDGRLTAPAEVRIRESGEQSVLELDVREGRRRQLRRMLDAVGHPVQRLIRIRYGPLKLGRLPPGESRLLNANEEQALLRLKGRAATRKQPARLRR